MSEDLYHECGVVALYHLDEAVDDQPFNGREAVTDNVASLVPGMLLDLQTRGQLAAGFTTYNPKRDQLIDTFKDVGVVSEVFRMSRPEKYASIIEEYAGKAAIGHTRYATAGADDVRYAQPFERHHGRLWKWFSFAFNGTVSNYADLRDKLLSRRGYHFSLNTDTEMVMHALAHGLRGEKKTDLQKVMKEVGREFDGGYSMAYLDAAGRLFVARDPSGIRPMSWAVQGHLFAAASESVALTNLGFTEIRTLEPGQMAIVDKGRLRFARFAPSNGPARCFFEWVYFANVASEIDGEGVYASRAATGHRLASMEDQKVDDTCIVVPVPDTAKAAADAFAYQLGIPSMEGIIRNRYVGRTFIQSKDSRERTVRSKYTPLASVLAGKRVFLLEDSIVRSTTLKILIKQIRQECGAAEIHVRVACPPVVAPCFYGIDMSTVGELFAPNFVNGRYKGNPTPDTLKKMAAALGVDSLRYLPVDQLGPTIGVDNDSLCLGCVTGKYPTEWGNKLARRARKNAKSGQEGRTYE